MASDAVYSKIAETFDYTATRISSSISRSCLHRKRGEFLLQLTNPITCKDLAKKLKVDDKTLAEKLEGSSAAGCFPRHDEFLFHIARHGFFARIGAAKDEDIPKVLEGLG